MGIVEGIGLALLAVFGTLASVSDIREGLVRNRLVGAGAVCACVLDAVYYGFFADGMFLTFLGNLAIASGAALALFFAHLWAGGDCKLMCVLAAMYPAGAYVAYAGQELTLVLVVLFAFLLGYAFLIARFVSRAVRREGPAVSRRQAGASLLRFLKAYALALVYVAAARICIGRLLPAGAPGSVAAWIAIACAVAWAANAVKVLGRKAVWMPVLAFDVAASVLLGTVPVGTDWRAYALVLCVVLVRVLVSGQNYRSIPTGDVRKGMILATATTLRLASSRIAGLPPLSTEDLRSRLTEDEARSVRRWGESSHGEETVMIVVRIPFAIFIVLGFAAYFACWGLAA